MPMPEILEAVTTLEEVTDVGEAVASVDLTTVSRQLDQMEGHLLGISFGQMLFCGVLLGAAVILVLAVMFRD